MPLLDVFDKHRTCFLFFLFCFTTILNEEHCLSKKSNSGIFLSDVLFGVELHRLYSWRVSSPRDRVGCRERSHGWI